MPLLPDDLQKCVLTEIERFALRTDDAGAVPDEAQQAILSYTRYVQAYEPRTVEFRCFVDSRAGSYSILRSFQDAEARKLHLGSEARRLLLDVLSRFSKPGDSDGQGADSGAPSASADQDIVGRALGVTSAVQEVDPRREGASIPQQLLAREPLAGQQAALTPADRAAGAVLGMLIGNALGVGCHWEYDPKVKRDVFGPWISEYCAPRPGRYHAGGSVGSGDVDQSGLIVLMLLESLFERDGYDEQDFCARWDAYLQTLDGTSKGAADGRYTEQDMIDVYQNRVVERKSWEEAASNRDHSYGATQAVVLAARFPENLPQLVALVRRNVGLRYADRTVQSHHVSFGLLIAALIQGNKFDSDIGSVIMRALHKPEQPVEESIRKQYPIWDSMYYSSWITRAVAEMPEIHVAGPAYTFSALFGPACSFQMVIGSAFAIASRYAHDFETAVTVALNSNGNNLARASLVGAIVGAIHGVRGIPKRWVDGLKNTAQVQRMARAISEAGSRRLAQQS